LLMLRVECSIIEIYIYILNIQAQVQTSIRYKTTKSSVNDKYLEYDTT